MPDCVFEFLFLEFYLRIEYYSYNSITIFKTADKVKGRRNRLFQLLRKGYEQT